MTERRGMALVALGSNLAHDGLKPMEVLCEAVRHFATQQLFVRARSRIWRSPPWPRNADATRGQPDYFNAIVACDVGALEPQMTVAALQRIEKEFGRARRTRWAARTLDLDLIDLD